jgi:hypothetical protein
MSESVEAVILRIGRRPVAESPLAEPPALNSDLGVALICPRCLGIDGQRRQFEDALLVECPDCGAHFSERLDTLSKIVLVKLTEMERRRHQFLGVGRRRRHTHAHAEHKPHQQQSLHLKTEARIKTEE